MGKTLLLTGYPGIGKTTVVQAVVARLDDRAGGFYTEEISGPGGRKGFRIITLAGREAVLAHKDLRGPKLPRVGRYGVDVQALERVGVAALRQAVQAGKIVVVDEIGKMELFSHAFRDTVMQAIMGPAIVLGTVAKKSHPEADVFKQLAHVTLWELDRGNRDTMADKVLQWLGEK